MGGATSLAAMRDPGGGWWTVEFRSAIGWDQGLRLDVADHSNAPGLVVHRIRDLGGPDAPASYLPKRVTYEGTVPIPSAGDDDWAGPVMSVRVVESSSTGAWVLVGSSLPLGQAARLTVEATATEGPHAPGPSETLALTGPDCTPTTHATELVPFPTTITARGSTTGFFSPSFLFSVNGASAGTWSGGALGTPEQRGIVTFRASVQVPTGHAAVRVEERDISARYVLLANQLALELPSGDGTYRVEVLVTAMDRLPVASVSEATATAGVDVNTLAVRLPAAAVNALLACEEFLAGSETGPGHDDRVRRQVAASTTAVQVAGADRLQIAERLRLLSLRSFEGGYFAAAVMAQEAVVTVLLDGLTDASTTAYSLAHAQALQTLALRQLDALAPLPGLDAARRAGDAYARAVALHGADSQVVSTAVVNLAAEMRRGTDDVALRPELQAPLGRLLRSLARVLLGIQAHASAAETALFAKAHLSIAAGLAQPDRSTLAEELTLLAGLLANVGQAPAGVECQQLAVRLLMAIVPTPESRDLFLINLAEGHHNLVARLLDDSRPSEASSTAAVALDAYEEYVATAKIDVHRINTDLTRSEPVDPADRDPLVGRTHPETAGQGAHRSRSDPSASARRTDHARGGEAQPDRETDRHRPTRAGGRRG